MEAIANAKGEKEAAPTLSGVPFDAGFFMHTFPERLKVACQGSSAEVPVVLLELADGRTLDLCHIDLLAPQWMAVSVFRETTSCEEMDVVFVPYEMVALITVSRRAPGQPRLGFQLEKSVPLRPGGMPETGAEPQACKTCAPA